MKIRIGGKKRKKKEELDRISQNNLIIPRKHDRVGNLNYYSEEIAKKIIDKLISLAVNKVYLKKVEEKMPKYYLRHFIKSTNNFIELCNINHDIDDMFSNKKINNNLTFSNHSINNKNNDIINNTFNEKRDVYKIDKKITKIQYSIKILNKNFWGDIPEPKAYAVDRTCNNKNILKNEPKRKQKENNKKKLTDRKSNSYLKHSSSKKTLFTLFHSKKFNNNNNDKNNETIKKKYTLIEFPSENIPDDQFSKQIETKEIKDLRKSFIEEMNKKKMEKEQEKKRRKIREFEIKKVKNDKKQKKKGNLMSIKEINPDSLIKEFNPVLSNQKEIKSGSSLTNLQKEKMKMELEAGKNIEYNKSKTKEKENKKDTIKKIILKDILKEIKKEEISGRLRPSGSNFAIMSPSVGVRIKENLNIKSGGHNFYEKFKRFSINDFNKTLQNEIKNKKFKYNDYITSTTGMSNLSLIREGKENQSNYNDLYNNTEEVNERNFRKTFSNRLNAKDLRKKNILKSKSEITLTNNTSKNNNNTNILKEVLTSREIDERNNFKKIFYSNYLNINNNDFDNYLDKTNYINNYKLLDRKIVSPIPTTRINDNQSIYFNNILNKGKNVHNKKAYKLMDSFNKKIVIGEYNDKMFGIEDEKNKNGILLPKIPFKKNKSEFKHQFYRTKNYFYRTRKRKNEENNKNFNSN